MEKLTENQVLIKNIGLPLIIMFVHGNYANISV